MYVRIVGPLTILNNADDGDITPESMVPGKRYVVQYGTTQHDSSIGTRSRTVTVQRQGTSDEMDYHRDGRPIYGGVWVIDHSDNDVEKFFFTLDSLISNQSGMN